jgi:tetratricopeptide (TPR) repeat protein/transcriptional regulator with XRE-family HTH domain
MGKGAAVTFGGLLRYYRLAAGLTQEALAERAGISERAVRDFERGTGRLPRYETLQLLLAALRLSAQERAMFAVAAQVQGTFAAPPARDGALSGPHAPALVGRADELAALARHLAGKGPPLLLVAGEPGIGKSRLLQEAAQRARCDGWTVLEDGCQRRGGQDPYAPLLGAIQRYVNTQLPVHLRVALRGCAWLVRLLPELADGPIEALPTWTVPPVQERRLLFEAVARFLGNVAGPSGTLLVLDDLQWSGTDALDLLVVLARGASQAPLRILGAYRDTEVQPADLLAGTLADLAGAELAAQHALRPLAPAEAAALLDRLLDRADGIEPALRERLMQRAGGVPFFLVSCARWLQAHTHVSAQAESIPWDLAQSIRQRVTALPASAREILSVASVVGRAVAAPLLTTVVACSEDVTLAALDTLCRTHLLVEGGSAAYLFAHDIIREVVEADLGGARRMVLHRRVAEALEQDSGTLPVELLAYHFSRSESHDKAVLYLERAGDHARAQTAYAAAEGYYGQLVDRLEQVGNTLHAARAQEKLAAVLRTTGRYEEALAVLERVADTYRAAADLEGHGRVTAEIGVMWARRGAPREGIQRLQSVLPLLESHGPSPALAVLQAALAELALCSDQLDHAPGMLAAERAIQTALAVGDARTRADAEIARGMLLFLMGHREEALRAWEETVPLAAAVGDLAILRKVLNNVGVAYVFLGAFDRARPYLHHALEVAERLGDPLEIAFQAGNHGSTAYTLGDWREARLYLEKAITLHCAVQANAGSYTNALLSLGQLCLAEGKREEASRHVCEAVAVAQRYGDQQVRQNAVQLHAECELLAGRPEAARACLLPVLNTADREDLKVVWLLSLLAWASAQLGELPAAENTAALAISRSRTEGGQLMLVDALRVQAMIALQAQRWEDARGALEEGLALARVMPYPYAEARLLQVYGSLHVERGEPEQARERLEAALAIFRRLGARKDIERTEHLLAALG